MSPLYKILVNGNSCHGGELAWSLPRGDEPGEWMRLPSGVTPALCIAGFHLTAEPYNWYRWGCECYEAEGRGLVGEQADLHKVCYSEARLLRRSVHPQWWLDAIEFVETVKTMPWFNVQGEPDPEWALFDTKGAAYNAVNVAASDVAQVAASDATWDAARDATRAAASDAARVAARVAAWAAASDVARVAARAAASDAARDAALDVAWDAAWDAALAVACIVSLPTHNPHYIHSQKRMDVWRRGYGLLCELEGKLYVYRRP